MPIYEYVCPNCGRHTERYLATIREDEPKSHVLCFCGTMAKLSIGNGVIDRRGRRWAFRALMEEGVTQVEENGNYRRLEGPPRLPGRDTGDLKIYGE